MSDHHHEHHDMAELLELDGQVLAPYLADVTAWVAELVPDPAGPVVDLGAGTGVGTFALAARFPAAEIIAVDNSPHMLHHIRAAAEHRNLRVGTVEADLAHGWPPVDRPGLVWAALSLHHVPDPEALLRQVHEQLRPGGLLVLSEMADQPYFLDREPWELRLHDTLARRQLGFDPYPDWTATLEKLGFDATRRDFPIEVSAPADLVRRYFLAFLRRMRAGLAEQLTPEDARTIDDILANDAAGLTPTVRTSRTVWAAQRSASTTA